MVKYKKPMLTTLTFVKTTTPQCAHIAGNVSAHTLTQSHKTATYQHPSPRGKLNYIYLYIKKTKQNKQKKEKEKDKTDTAQRKM